MTPAEIITDARLLLQDTVATYRHSDAELLSYVNAAIGEAAILNPPLFATIGDMTCVTGQAEQALDRSSALSLLGVVSHHNGTAIHEFDLSTMDAFAPTWRAAAAAAATGWARSPGDPLRFFVSPPAPANQTICVRYVRVPSSFASGATITEIGAAYKSALTDYVVGRALLKEDEAAVNEKAAGFLGSFAAKIKG